VRDVVQDEILTPLDMDNSRGSSRKGDESAQLSGAVVVDESPAGPS
jgi:hypothetical protein